MDALDLQYPRFDDSLPRTGRNKILKYNANPSSGIFASDQLVPRGLSQLDPHANIDSQFTIVALVEVRRRGHLVKQQELTENSWRALPLIQRHTFHQLMRVGGSGPR